MNYEVSDQSQYSITLYINRDNLLNGNGFPLMLAKSVINKKSNDNGDDLPMITQLECDRSRTSL